MQSLHLFVFQTNSNLLQSFFNSVFPSSPPIDWKQSPDQLVLSLTQTIDACSSNVVLNIQHELSRIQRMSRQYAQECMLKLVEQEGHFLAFTSSTERSCWLYLYEYQNFVTAELTCLKHPLFFSQRCGHFLVNSNRAISTISEERLPLFCNEFLKKIDNKFTFAKAYFCRPTSMNGGEEKHRLQLNFFYSEWSEKQIVIKRDKLKGENVKKVIHYVIVYDSLKGAIDVIAPEMPRQTFLAHLFSHLFLDKQEVVYRTFSLAPFMNNQPLALDEGDGIESISINQITLKNTECEHIQRIDFPPGNNSQLEISEYLEVTFGTQNEYLSDVFLPIAVTFSLCFYKDNDSNRKKQLVVKLTLPNQTNLGIFTESERTLIEKYLILWSVKDVV